MTSRCPWIMIASVGLAMASVSSGHTPLAAGGERRAPTFSSLVFDSEWIELSFAEDSLEVRGTFVLRCHDGGSRPIPLLLPFPSDSLMGGARMVSLLARSGTAPFAPARWESIATVSGARWWLPPCDGDSIVAKVVYRQGIRPGYARYIVTTIANWGRPIRYGKFEIRLPPGVTPLEFSFPFERNEIGGEPVYIYEVTDFLPDRDIEVRWAP